MKPYLAVQKRSIVSSEDYEADKESLVRMLEDFRKDNNGTDATVSCSLLSWKIMSHDSIHLACHRPNLRVQSTPHTIEKDIAFKCILPRHG